MQVHLILLLVVPSKNAVDIKVKYRKNGLQPLADLFAASVTAVVFFSFYHNVQLFTSYSLSAYI